MMMPVVHPEEDRDKTRWIAMFMANWLRVANMIFVCMQQVVQQFVNEPHLGDLDWLCTFRIIGTCR